ncbi:MAG: TIGR00282 family metallophosphoesterase [Clostridia bacterium]|nr:TIGR00282 family metallophosphoesterase [Clostridia bacterium]
MLRILALGDIVGENGLKKAKEILPELKQKENIDFVIANGENVAGGMGITHKLYKELIEMGVEVVTLGNHTWAKKDIFSFIDEEKRLIRPANYSQGIPGKGYVTIEAKGKKITVINLIGRTEMSILSENPFIKVKEILSQLEKNTDIIVVDFHAEASAEKIAMGYYLDGQVSVVFGTHTHVQTADEVILEKGTGYITDIGMTGPLKSIIGMDIAASLKRFETSLPERYKLAEGSCGLSGCIFDIDDANSRTTNIKRIKM